MAELRNAKHQDAPRLASPERPKPGDVFEHMNMLAADLRSHASCTVTGVIRDRVYWTYTSDYDKGDRRGAWWFPLDKQASHVRAWTRRKT